MATLAVLLGLVLLFALVFAATAAWLQTRRQRDERRRLDVPQVSVSALARVLLRRGSRTAYVWTTAAGRGSLRLHASTAAPTEPELFAAIFSDGELRVLAAEGVALPFVRIGVRLLPSPKLVAFNPNAGGLCDV